MSKDEQKIMVVKRDILFGDSFEDYFNGFTNDLNYESKILNNFEIMRRGDAEINSCFKQPIGYAILANLNHGKIFAYQRASKDERYGEKRLQGKWSWGFGGHIELFDTKNGNPILDSMVREVTKEELEIKGDILYKKVLGYINDDTNDVGKVHFGILYLLNTDAEKVNPKDSEIALIEPKTINELEEICSNSDFDVETWSQIALEPLRKLL